MFTGFLSLCFLFKVFHGLGFNLFLNLFQGLTAYHDIALDKCYITELNTTLVMPPRNLWELLVNVKVRRLLHSLSYVTVEAAVKSIVRQ